MNIDLNIPWGSFHDGDTVERGDVLEPVSNMEDAVRNFGGDKVVPNNTRNVLNNLDEEGTANVNGEESDSIDTEGIRKEIEIKLDIGSRVDNLDQAYLLYCRYARFVGFSVRKGDQTYFRGTDQIRTKEYKCSCEGVHEDKRINHRLAVYKKQLTRTHCKAKLRIVGEKLSDNLFEWRVQKFYKEHNHELVPIHQSHMLRSARQLTHAKESLLEALNSVGIGVSHAYRFLAKECGGPENIGFTKRDAYNHLSKKKLKTSVDNADANALVQSFVRKSKEEPFFYWNFQLDDDGRIMNFFFRDSRCLIDYEHFGDVLSVDTTYRTNKYDLICAPFIGINHHMKNVMFGLAFLSNETSTSFEWLFNCFLESMHGKEPQIIFSDQSQALMNGIDRTFRTASHRLCQWHISQNAPSHFGSLKNNKEFYRKWRYCMNGVETEAEFEACWKSLIQTYSLGDKVWFSNMYKLRKRWAAVFTNTSFSNGLLATSRSEVTNKVLKDLCSATTPLSVFFDKYQQIITDWRISESDDDFRNIGTPGLLVSNSLILSQASKVLTRAVFQSFELQFALATAVVIVNAPENVNDIDLVYEVASQPYMQRIRRVEFNRLTQNAMCSCCMWQTEGVICRHIFRIYMHMNVTQIPQHYFLHRWSKCAKQRHPLQNGWQGQLNGSGFVDEMAFTNYAMRLTLELSHAARSNGQLRKKVLECLTKLNKEVNVASNGSVVAPKENGFKVRDPKPKRRTRPLETSPKSHWDSKKRKSHSRCPIPRWPDVACSQESEPEEGRSHEILQTPTSHQQTNVIQHHSAQNMGMSQRSMSKRSVEDVWNEYGDITSRWQSHQSNDLDGVHNDLRL